MKTSFLHVILDTLFFGFILMVALVISTLALTYKVNEYKEILERHAKVTVIKENVPILSFTRGVVKKILVKPGELVKKDQKLIEIDNPATRERIEALESVPENLSAQTEALITRIELEYFTLTSPINGVVGEINVSEGSPVENLTQIMNIYSNDNVKLLASLSNDEYHAVERLSEIQAYHPRINQNFTLIPDKLKPDIEEKEQIVPVEDEEKKLGLYLTLENDEDAASLIHNEDLELLVTVEDENIYKPIDFIVDFWNRILKTE